MAKFYVRVPGKDKGPARWKLINDTESRDLVNEPDGGRLYLRTPHGWAVHDESAYTTRPLRLRDITNKQWHRPLSMRPPIVDEEVWQIVHGSPGIKGARSYAAYSQAFTVDTYDFSPVTRVPRDKWDTLNHPNPAWFINYVYEDGQGHKRVEDFNIRDNTGTKNTWFMATAAIEPFDATRVGIFFDDVYAKPDEPGQPPPLVNERGKVYKEYLRSAVDVDFSAIRRRTYLQRHEMDRIIIRFEGKFFANMSMRAGPIPELPYDQPPPFRAYLDDVSYMMYHEKVPSSDVLNDDIWAVTLPEIPYGSRQPTGIGSIEYFASLRGNSITAFEATQWDPFTGRYDILEYEIEVSVEDFYANAFQTYLLYTDPLYGNPPLAENHLDWSGAYLEASFTQVSVHILKKTEY